MRQPAEAPSTADAERPTLGLWVPSALAAVLGGGALLVAGLSLYAPMMVTLAFIPLALCAAAAWAAGMRPAFPRRDILLACAALIAWALLSALWSAEPFSSLQLAARVGATLAGGIVIVAAARALPGEMLRLLGLATAASFLLMLLAIGWEIATGLTLLAWMRGLVDQSGPLYLNMLNRGATFLGLIAWPVAAIVAQRTGSRWLGLIAPAVGLLAIWPLESGTAVFALAAGLVAGGTTLLWQRGVVRVLPALVALSILAAPLLGQLRPLAWPAYADAMPLSASHRLLIWQFSAERALERPLLGWGMNASRWVPGRSDQAPYGAIGGQTLTAVQLPLHPHNGSLQIWLELGLVGAIIAAAGAWLVTAAAVGVGTAAPWTLGFVVTAMGVSSLAYGTWQYHWISSVLIAAALMAAAARRPGQGHVSSGRAGASAGRPDHPHPPHA